ncbi:MAG: PDZ domain-containing protein [Gemmatimonadota bacterium]
MASAESGTRSRTFLIIAALLVLWGLFGTFDVARQPYSGYQTDGNNTVTSVSGGSPAEAAGLRVGDRIRSIGGVSVEDTRGLTRQGRAEIGETRTLGVERDGETVELGLEYAALPGTQRAVAHLAALIGLCFLLFGLWAHSAAPGRSTMLLAVLGLLFAPALLSGPYLASATLRLLTGTAITAAILLGLAVLLDFLVTYPEGTSRRKSSIYAPAVVVVLIAAGFFLLQPPATSGVNVFFRLLFGLFVVAYFGLGIVVVVRNYTGASPERRAAHGLGLMLFGTLVGLLPVTIGSLSSVIAPTLVLPGAPYYFLTLALIPITFAVAAVQSGRGAGLATAAAGAPMAPPPPVPEPPPAPEAPAPEPPLAPEPPRAPESPPAPEPPPPSEAEAFDEVEEEREPYAGGEGEEEPEPAEPEAEEDREAFGTPEEEEEPPL